MTVSARARSATASTLLAVAGSALAAALVVPGTAHADDAAVAATGANVFDPTRVDVAVGDTVTWTTTGGVNHTVTSSSANWSKDDSIPLVSRTTSFTFEAGGTYSYYCKTHGSPTGGMRGIVAVAGKPAPKPTTAAPRPSPSRTTAAPKPTSAAPRPSPSRSTAAPSPSGSVSPSARASSAGPPPIGVPSASPAELPGESPVPLPSVAAPDPSDSDAPLVDLGSGGLGPRPTTDRGRGLPAFIALVALGGVVSAQIRALLALPPSD